MENCIICSEGSDFFPAPSKQRLSILIPGLKGLTIQNNYDHFPSHDFIRRAQTRSRIGGNSSLDPNTLPELEKMSISVFPLDLSSLIIKLPGLAELVVPDFTLVKFLLEHHSQGMVLKAVICENGHIFCG